MPDVNEYAAGFGLKTGLRFGEYELTAVSIDHKQVVLYNEYAYPSTFTMTWRGAKLPTTGNVQTMFNAFTVQVQGIRVIRTSSNRPYKCAIHWPLGTRPTYTATADYTTVALAYTGYAKRIGEAEAKRIMSGLQGW